MICLIRRLWLKCRLSWIKDSKKLRKPIRTRTTNLTKKCGSWKGKKRKLPRNLNLSAETKCRSLATSLKSWTSCKTKLKGLARSLTRSRGSETRRLLNISRNLKRSAKFSIKRSENSTRRVRRPSQNKLSFFLTTSANEQSGTSSWQT